MNRGHVWGDDVENAANSSDWERWQLTTNVEDAARARRGRCHTEADQVHSSMWGKRSPSLLLLFCIVIIGWQLALDQSVEDAVEGIENAAIFRRGAPLAAPEYNIEATDEKMEDAASSRRGAALATQRQVKYAAQWARNVRT